MGQSLGRKRKSRKNSPTAEQQSTASSSTAPTTTAAAVATTTTVDANTSTTAVEQPSSSTTTTTTVVAEQQPSTTTTTTAEAPSSQVVDVAPTTTTTTSSEEKVVVEEQKTVAVEAVVTTPVAVEEEVVQVAPVEHQEQVVDEPTPTAQAPVEQEAPQEEEKIVEQPSVEQETVAIVVESTPTTTTTTQEEEEEMKPTTEAPQEEEEAPQQEQQAEEEQTEFNGSLTFSVSSHLHKYIVGPKGATIKGIQQSSGDEKLRIDLNSEENQVTITSNDNKAILSAKHQIEEVIAPHKDKLNVDAMKESKDYKVPSALHKYILGDRGSTLKSIQSEAQCNLTLNENDSITIKSTSQELIEKAFQLVVATLEKFWWYYDASTEIFTENTLTDRLFKQYRTKVSEQHELMTECYEKSKQAFDEGRKDEAKELSEQGKKHKELKEQYSKEAALAIFEEMNKDKGEDSIDLHGLLVSEALEFVEQRIQKLTESKSINILNVITGAGNHSEAEAKIKPMIAKMLDEKSLKYEKGNEGVFIVTLF